MTTSPQSSTGTSPWVNLLINLTFILFWLVLAGGLILGKINMAGRSGYIGLLCGLTFTWLILSPFIHRALHKRVLNSRESDPRQQVLINLRLVLLITIAVVLSSVAFALIHQNFLVVMK